MRMVLALAFLLAFSIWAEAQSFHEWRTVCIAFPGHCQIGGIPTPPPQFRGPYKGKITVIPLSKAALQLKCVSMGAIACTTGRHTPGRCPIYLDRTLPPERKRQAIQHEIAHCKGWRHAVLQGLYWLRA